MIVALLFLSVLKITKIIEYQDFNKNTASKIVLLSILVFFPDRV